MLIYYENQIISNKSHFFYVKLAVLKMKAFIHQYMY